MSIQKKSSLISDISDTKKFKEYINSLDDDVKLLFLFSQGRVQGNQGVSGTFTDNDGNTVTVTNGIITDLGV